MKTSADAEEVVISGQFNRLNDSYFKYVIAAPERKHLTLAFLNAVLRGYLHKGERFIEVEDVDYLDREAVADWQGAKVPRFDVFVRSSDGRVFHIEVQDDADKYFLKRSLFYTSHDFVMQSRRGLSYEEFEPVIYIGLVNFNVMGNGRKSREWYTVHRVLDAATHECKFSWTELRMIELPKLRSKRKKLGDMPSTELEAILFYFGNIGGDKVMEAVAEKYPVIDELLDAEKKYRSDPLLLRQYLFAEAAHRDYLLNLKAEREEGEKRGHAKGIKQGRKEGRQEERDNMIRLLRAKGICTDEQIANLFDSPIELIQQKGE